MSVDYYYQIIRRTLMEMPFWEKYSLSIEEAALYFRIGENKLRAVVSQDPYAEYILWNGNRPQIKRRLFELYLDKIGSV